MTGLGVIAGIGAAPVLPAISTLGAVLAFCLAVALSVMWFQILRGPLVRLAKLSILHVHPFGWLTTVVHNVDHWLNATVEGTERAVTWSLHSLMWSISTGAQLTADLAQATWQGLDWWKRHTTRHVGPQTGQSIDPRVKKLEQEFRGIDARLDELSKREKVQRGAGAAAGTADHAQLQKGIDRLTKRVGHLAHELDAVEHANAHAGARARPGEVAVPRTAPRVVPRTHAPSRHWTDILTKASAAALVSYALARWGASWLKCQNWKKIGNRLCKFDSRWLDALLAGIAVIFVSKGIVPFAKDVQGIMGRIAPAVQHFWGAEAIGPGYDRRLGDFAPSSDA